MFPKSALLSKVIQSLRFDYEDVSGELQDEMGRELQGVRVAADLEKYKFVNLI